MIGVGGLIIKLDIQCVIEMQTVCDIKNHKVKLIKSPGRL